MFPSVIYLISGEISIAEWCKAMEEGTGLQIPWRLLKEKLVTMNSETNRIKYRTTFDVDNEELNVSKILNIPRHTGHALF